MGGGAELEKYCGERWKRKTFAAPVPCLKLQFLFLKPRIFSVYEDGANQSPSAFPVGSRFLETNRIFDSNWHPPHIYLPSWGFAFCSLLHNGLILPCDSILQEPSAEKRGKSFEKGMEIGNFLSESNLTQINQENSRRGTGVLLGTFGDGRGPPFE